MLDIKFVRENPDAVKENIKKKFQDAKLPLVDEVIELDKQARALQQEADELRAKKNAIAKQIGALMAQGKKEESEEVKKEVAKNAARLAELEKQEPQVREELKKKIVPVRNNTRLTISQIGSKNRNICANTGSFPCATSPQKSSNASASNFSFSASILRPAVSNSTANSGFPESSLIAACRCSRSASSIYRVVRWSANVCFPFSV